MLHFVICFVYMHLNCLKCKARGDVWNVGLLWWPNHAFSKEWFYILDSRLLFFFFFNSLSEWFGDGVGGWFFLITATIVLRITCIFVEHRKIMPIGLYPCYGMKEIIVDRIIYSPTFMISAAWSGPFIINYTALWWAEFLVGMVCQSSWFQNPQNSSHGPHQMGEEITNWNVKWVNDLINPIVHNILFNTLKAKCYK